MKELYAEKGQKAKGKTMKFTRDEQVCRRRGGKNLDSRLRGNDKNNAPRPQVREFNKMPLPPAAGLNNKQIPYAAFGGFGMTHRVAQGAAGG